MKLVSQSNNGIQVTSNSKRLSSSPTGISPPAKPSCEKAAANRAPARSRQSLNLRDVPSSLNSEKENLDPMDVAANRTPPSRLSLDPMDVANSLADRIESEMNFLWFQKILSIYTPQKFIVNSDGEEVPKPKSFMELKWNFHTSGG